MKETDMAVVVSASQNEQDDFKKKGVDIYHKKGDWKLYSRYSRLLNYFESRKALWISGSIAGKKV